MIRISFSPAVVCITCLWILTRAFFWIRARKISIKREAELIAVYICLVVVTRFTFFPFSRANGQVPPLFFDPSRLFPPRINLVPIVYLFDYESFQEALTNVLGNTAMFVPVGILWPAVFRQLDTHKKVIGAGMGLSLFIEVLQLPFYDRVTDIDDLLLNTLGYFLGYGLFLLFRNRSKNLHRCR